MLIHLPAPVCGRPAGVWETPTDLMFHASLRRSYKALRGVARRCEGPGSRRVICGRPAVVWERPTNLLFRAVPQKSYKSVGGAAKRCEALQGAANDCE